jgi:hypothetical protein
VGQGGGSVFAQEAAASQLGSHAFAEPVGLFQVGVAGEDELVDAQRVLLRDQVGDLGMAAHEGGSRAAADQADPRPEARVDLQTADTGVSAPWCSCTIRCCPTDSLAASWAYALATCSGSRASRSWGPPAPSISACPENGMSRNGTRLGVAGRVNPCVSGCGWGGQLTISCRTMVWSRPGPTPIADTRAPDNSSSRST